MIDAEILIGDERPGGHSCLEIVDPSKGEVFAHVPDGSPANLKHAVETAKRAGVAWATTAPAARAAVLRRLASLILREQEALAVLEALQTGKPLKQSRRDAEITARYFDFYSSAIESFHGETIPLNRDTLIYTGWEPHGVTAHIVPWNYPMSIMARSIVPSLAMGNACVLKPAEATPLTALRIGELALEAGLSPGLFNIVTGTGHGAGAALYAHLGIGHISFTGSVAVGA